MSKILIAYFSQASHTEAMAQFIAEGVRMSGGEAAVKKVSALKAEDLEGYDGYIFGSPTYHLDMSEPVKKFLTMAEGANLAGKAAGAFGSYTHTGDAPGKVLEIMENTLKMVPSELSSFKLLEAVVDPFDSPDRTAAQLEGMRACQNYGQVFTEQLGE